MPKITKPTKGRRSVYADITLWVELQKEADHAGRALKNYIVQILKARKKK